MRKHWLDNLRWTTVIIVLIYHVFYFYNAKGVFGGIGGFYETQPQDAIMSLIYPWIMMLLFVVAGMSSKYALEKCSHKEFIKSRTRKLLVPATIGLFVFQWMTGYFNTQIAGVSQGIADKIQTIPTEARYIACALSGTGPLWFIQDLWLFSLILILIRLLKGDKIHSAFGNLINNKANNWVGILIIVLGGYFVVWGATQTNISYPEPNSGEDLWNLYRPAEYFITFLLGYFVFSHDKVIELAKRICLPMLAISLASGIVFAIRIYGLDDTNPIVLKDWLTNIFAWSTILSLIGCFAKWTDKTSRFAAYMAKSSFGIYVMHYLVIASLGYMLKMYTQLPPLAIYAILLASVLLISPALNELISRIPFIRWCVLGINKRKHK